MRLPSFIHLSLLVVVLPCAESAFARKTPPPSTGSVGAGTPDGENIIKARAKGQKRLFEWVPFSKEAFERAKTEHRFVLLDGAAEWCHWCHVMDETTYADPRVGAVLSSRFVAIRVDIDERPDIGERYAEYGWPATILFSPEGEEIGKLRGYVESERLLHVLDELGSRKGGGTVVRTPDVGDMPASVETLSWIGAAETLSLDEFYDEEQGGWGHKQKLAVGTAVELEVRRWRHGDLAAAKRVLFTLKQQRAILDPVWGGLYQYSAATDWSAPHFEKLMAFQAANIEAYARAAALPDESGSEKNPALDDARHIAEYVDQFLSAESGAFHPNQDADAGAHDRSVPFVDGHVFYAKDDAGRRRLGMPRVDPHVYPRETAMAIAALATLYEVSHEARWLVRAKRAAEAIQASFVLPDGTVIHEAENKEGPFLLGDGAWTGYALARLGEVSGEAIYRDRAVVVARALRKNFDDGHGGVLGGTPDVHAAGVFAHPALSFSDAVAAARCHAALGRIHHDSAQTSRAREVLAAIATPRALSGAGRFVGDFLLALDEVGKYPWLPAPAK